MPQLCCNNALLYYSVSGIGSETIVFSHGLLFDHSMWKEQIAYFEKLYRCIAYDHRGQGQSESTGSLDMDTLFEDAASLIEQLSPDEPVHFVGLSMGGFVGMRLAARKPHLLRSLILLETSADPEVNKFNYTLLTWIFRTLGFRSVSKKVMRILFGKSSINDPSKQEQLNYWKSRMSSYPSFITKAIDGVIHRRGVYDEIAKINTPTLVIVGDEDIAATPEMAKRIHTQIKNSIITIIPRAGHSSCIEQPEEVNRNIKGFIQKEK
jgi:pimeloyl-ACP methyl ester carboxylesterase